MEDRLDLVFGGTVAPIAWRRADPEGRRALVAHRFGGLDERQVLVRWVVVEELLGDDPPEVWATTRRLTADGMDVERALGQIDMLRLHLLAASAVDSQPMDEAAYVRGLARLPLPDADAISRAVLDVAAAAGVLPSDDLEAAATARLGFDTTDELVVALVVQAADDLVEEPGPLAWLSGDRTAHVAALCDGIVLTHVLEEDEQRRGELTVSFDLAGFNRFDRLRVDRGALEVISTEDDHLAWRGPAGWLEHLPVGGVLAVRVDLDGVVDLGVLPAAPPVDADLVASLTAVYAQIVEEPGLPASGEDLVLELLAEDRRLFDQPRAPLAALCEAAGLERRGSLVAGDPALWTNQRRLRRVHRVVGALGDDELVEPVLDVLGLVDDLDSGAPVEPGDIPVALGLLADPDVLATVCADLFDADEPLDHAPVVVEALLAGARNDTQRAAARFLAALSAEVARDWAAAEQHLELAVEADLSHANANDRLAWYASDRGDAARAVRLWRRCPPSARVGQDIAAVEPFNRATGSTTGRNDPCWCGSGRKYKQCHLGVVAPHPLPERIGWLLRKAAGYTARTVPGPDAYVAAILEILAGDDEALEEAADDPLILDLLLNELGWFERFLADRGHLLPDDEALLAAAWATVDRSVHEVTATSPGAGLTVRDLRTGDVVDVREQTSSRGVRPGTLVMARVVPDGVAHQFVGGIVAVPPGTEPAVLAMLDRGDAYEIAAWARDVRRPPLRRS